MPGVRYLRDAVYGAIDGAVTTFAVVAGATGANLSDTIVVIMGVANLIADGFSMGVSNFLGSRAERQQRARARRGQEHEIAHNPEAERAQLRAIYAAKGFAGADLDRVVAVLTADERRWIETIMTEELGYGRDESDPLRAAATTFWAFLIVGALPLAVFIYDLLPFGDVSDPFAWSAALTGVAFFAVGAVKARLVDQRWWRSGAETLLIGGAAATLAFLAGVALEGVG
jgi:VIT1/CCC1 family predicted Fe2+/Mn2+ transporter